VFTSDHICDTEEIAAFIDGDLDPAARSALEEHIKQCSRCALELQAQRQFMCELDSALASPFDLAVPPNFAQVVAVHAESDMRGVRDRAENRKAFRICVILGLMAFALLGVTAGKALVFGAQSLADKTLGVLGFFAKTSYDAAAGFTVVSRVFSRGFISDSRLIGLLSLLLVVLAVGLLFLLISRYHRTRLTE
jgi:putative zinc finger protein